MDTMEEHSFFRKIAFSSCPRSRLYNELCRKATPMTKNNTRTTVQFFIAEWYENSNGKFELSLGERYAEFPSHSNHYQYGAVQVSSN